jgi:hypothetical protein
MSVSFDTVQIARIAEVVADLPEVEPVDFCGSGLGADLFPERDEPWAVDYFFAVTLHQYGFWTDDGNRYLEPYYGTLDGQPRKGAEFMFRAMLKAARKFPVLLSPERQANMTAEQMAAIFAEDDGICRLPMLDTHLELTRQYGRYLVARNVDPDRIVAECNRSNNPAKAFVATLQHIPGYAEDPLEKKLFLLAIILKNRPEKFLAIQNSDLRPVVDYHIQRTFLRTGMVAVTPGALRSSLENRTFVQATQEESIRRAAFQAVDLLCKESGKDVAAIDWFFFKMRKTCHEMQAPDCATCPVKGVCRQQVDLFQPVFRTTYY